MTENEASVAKPTLEQAVEFRDQLRRFLGIEIELPPGSYEVEISADGFAAQTRRLSIDEQGVTVINIDLRPRGAR